MGHGGMGMGDGGTGGMMRGGMGMFGINGRSFDMERIDHTAQLGDTEIWQVSGDMMAHPFHIHGVHFEVLKRAGSCLRSKTARCGTLFWSRTPSSCWSGLPNRPSARPSCSIVTRWNTRTLG